MAAVSTGLTSFSAMLRRKRVLSIDRAAIQAYENKISDVMNLLDKEPIHLGIVSMPPDYLGIKYTIVTFGKKESPLAGNFVATNVSFKTFTGANNRKASKAASLAIYWLRKGRSSPTFDDFTHSMLQSDRDASTGPNKCFSPKQWTGRERRILSTNGVPFTNRVKSTILNAFTNFGIHNSCKTNPKPRKELYGRCEEIDREPGRSPLRTNQKNLEPFHELTDDFAESFRRPFLLYILCFLAMRSSSFRFKRGNCHDFCSMNTFGRIQDRFSFINYCVT